ncbi:MAG: glyoxylate/hydroxypyruvate reductase A [Alphaproteobacteria bacterium]|nr:glyoxylate/hydroxypyruvate reductase A [Alphaproteobacteria bacterium]
MSLIFACVDIPPEPWVKAIKAEIPDLTIHLWPDVDNPEKVEFALLWGKWDANLNRFPELSALLSLGAGVDHILTLENRPPNIPIIRLGDPALRTGMVEYVLYNVLKFHRRFPEYEEQQEKSLWIERSQTMPYKRTVGIMGLGSLGSACAKTLVGLGFDVIGWSRRKKTINKVGCFYGEQGLGLFLARSEIVVCLLPLTNETRGILNTTNMQKLPAGAFIINAARGGHLIEGDLLALLESEHIAGAALDVFETEPLPANNPLWSHSKVTVTPHVAALVDFDSAATVIAETIRRSREGRPLLNVVDPVRGY